MSDSDGPFVPEPLSEYELQRLENMRIIKEKLDAIEREQSMREQSMKHKRKQSVCDVKIEVDDDDDDDGEKDGEKDVKYSIKPTRKQKVVYPPMQPMVRGKRTSQYSGGYNYLFSSDEPVSVAASTLVTLQSADLPPKKRRIVDDDSDYAEAGNNSDDGATNNFYFSDQEIDLSTVIKFKLPKADKSVIKTENARIKEERVQRSYFVRDATPSALSSLHAIAGFEFRHDNLFTSSLFYQFMNFRNLPEFVEFDRDPSVSTDIEMRTFFESMCEKTQLNSIVIYGTTSGKFVEVGGFFQTDIDHYIQSADGTVLLTDDKYTFVGSAIITKQIIYCNRLFLRSTECIASIGASEDYNLHFHQIYDRILLPKVTSSGSQAFVRAYNTRMSNCLVPIIVDSKGREIKSAFREKEFLTPILYMSNLRLEHAKTLGKMTEDDCHIRFELVQGDMCIAYKMFPVKMCNSFHALKSDAAKWQRGGSKLMPLLRDIGSLSDLLDDDAICKRTRRLKTGDRVFYDEEFPDLPPLRSTAEDTGGASTDTVMDAEGQ